MRKRRRVKKTAAFILVLILIAVVVSIAFAVNALKDGDDSEDENNSKPVALVSFGETPTPEPTSEPTPEPTPKSTPKPTLEPTPSPTPIPANPKKTPAPVHSADLKSAVYVKNGERAAYLTFDDGPTKTVTPLILDVLKEYNVKASFFVIGSLAEANPGIMQRAYDEGHLILNHLYSHDYKKIYADVESFKSEIVQTENIIRNTLCIEPVKIIRFPGGSFEKNTEFKDALIDMGYKHIDWNALNGDAEGQSRTVEQLVQRIKETAKAEDVVVLMHDATSKKNTALALPQIIQYLKEQGFTFKRLDQ